MPQQEEEGPVSAALPTLTRKDSLSSDEAPLPSGVFTLLTDCYSPTCSRDQLCYSIACPRRLEQQARLNMKPQPGLSKQISRESLGDVPVRFFFHSCLPQVLLSFRTTERYGFTLYLKKFSIVFQMQRNGVKRLSMKSYTLSVTLCEIWNTFEM